jgi:origin recognition complex subunit 5
LRSLYTSACTTPSTSATKLSPLFNPRLQPLYGSFIEHLLHTSIKFTKDPVELAYLAAANWPRFLQPWLEALLLQAKSSPSRPSRRDATAEDGEEEDIEMEGEEEEPVSDIPDETARMRLLSSFKSSFRDSLNTLYPRVSTGAQWEKVPHSLDPQLQTAVSRHGQALRDEQRLIKLHGLTRWIALASFFASYNPPKTDLRLFSRGAGEERKKKKGGGTRKVATRKGKAKVRMVMGIMVLDSRHPFRSSQSSLALHLSPQNGCSRSSALS